MPYKLRKFICPECHTEHEKRGPSGSSQLCVLCGIERSARTVTQLHARSGPAWDHWAARMHQVIGCPLASVHPLTLAAWVEAYGREGRTGTSPTPGT